MKFKNLEIGKTHLKKLLGKGVQKSYSQFGEDAVLCALFRRKKKGRYVDVGAYHPVLYSNTYALYQRGWTGIVIDPNEKLFPLYRHFRGRDQFVASAVGSGDFTYYEFEDPAYNSADDAMAQRWIDNGIRLISKTPVHATPLHELVTGHIDLLNIDVEGMDLAVLETVDWSKPPTVVVVEDHSYIGTPTSITKFLVKQNYVMVGLCGPSLIFKYEGTD